MQRTQNDLNLELQQQQQQQVKQEEDARHAQNYAQTWSDGFDAGAVAGEANIRGQNEAANSAWRSQHNQPSCQVMRKRGTPCTNAIANGCCNQMCRKHCWQRVNWESCDRHKNDFDDIALARCDRAPRRPGPNYVHNRKKKWGY